MSKVIIGKDAKFYYKSGGLWYLITIVQNLTLDINVNEVDASPRGNGGWKATTQGWMDAHVDFEIVWDKTAPEYAIFANGFFNRTDVELAIMDGPVNIAGSEGLQGSFVVTKFKRSESLADTVTASISVRPSTTGTLVAWVIV